MDDTGNLVAQALLALAQEIHQSEQDRGREGKTKVELLLEILSQGPTSIEEMAGLVDDTKNPEATIRVKIAQLNQRLKPRGWRIESKSTYCVTPVKRGPERDQLG